MDAGGAFRPGGADAFPAGVGGSAFDTPDPETGLPLWTATRLATLQAKLAQRLGPEFLSQRPGPGGGVKLTYIEGWRVVDLANEVFGFNGWSTSIQRIDIDYLDVQPESARCSCGVSAVVRITLRDGTFHEDIGYGHCDGVRGKAAALEKCKKEAVTDSIKRGLKTFGRLLGNCLYDRDYASAVLRMSAPRARFNAEDLHRHEEKPQRAERPPKREADEDPAKAARLRQAEAAKAAHRERWRGERGGGGGGGGGPQAQAQAPPPAGATPDPEAESMAVELELEDELLLRQSQLEQELAESE